MAAARRAAKPTVKVEELYAEVAEPLSLTVVAGRQGLSNKITSPRIQKLGLALTGYTDYLHRGRVQFIGRSEINYMKGLSERRKKKAARDLFAHRICCIFVTTRLRPPAEIVAGAEEHGVPIFRTRALSSTAIAEVTAALEEKLAPTTTVHGVLTEVFGVGVFLKGASGIGKSECALDLILRGHRLISDDVVIIKKVGAHRLVGYGPPDFKFHMEVRGLGIVNIKDLFGISALSSKRSVDLAIDLVHWQEDEEYDRLGLEERELDLLGVSVPLITVPVASGRNLATLVEVAVRIQMLKSQGYNPSGEFFRNLKDRLAGGGEDEAGS